VSLTVPQPRISSTPSVRHRWWLCDAQSMDQIAELTTAHQRQLVLQLNSWGTATFWLHPLDPVTAYLDEHAVALRCDRNGVTVWSGPIYQINDNADNQGNNQCSVTAMGWLQVLNQRDMHCGAEFASMLALWEAETGGSYTSLGIDTAIQLAYSATQFGSGQNDAAIMLDLLERANIDSPTLIVPGSVYGSPPERNLTIQRLANVGQQMQTLVNVEDGSDVYVDPVTREMNLYGMNASPSPTIQNGMGVDRGEGCLFTFPGNCIVANRTGDGTKTANRINVQGQYGYAVSNQLPSQLTEGLFEDVASLSNVVDPNILAAYANAEALVRQYPWTIITMTPRGLGPDDDEFPGVPRPFEDYFLGDITYGVIDYGPRFQVGTGPSGPQPLRVFGLTLNVDDGGLEKVSAIQTTYASSGAPA
jgi:hypothetical protein